MSFSLQNIKHDIENKCIKALEEAGSEIEDIFIKASFNFYNEYSPSVYKRTYGLYPAIKKDKNAFSKSSFSTRVYYDPSSFSVNPETQNRSIRAIFQNVMMGENPHGWYGIGGTPVWLNTKENLDREADLILLKALANAGLPIIR